MAALFGREDFPDWLKTQAASVNEMVQRNWDGVVDPAEVKTMAETSQLWATYATEIDRPSAREMLAQKMGVETPVRPDLPPAPA